MKKILLLLSLIMCVTLTQAKDIKVVVGNAAGGASDQIARMLSKFMSNDEYSFTVINKVGGGGIVAANYVADAKNETVLMIATPGLISAPLIGSVAYDINKDFIFVDVICTDPYMLLVKEDSNIKNYKDFIEESKKSAMPFGHPGHGSGVQMLSTIIANGNKNFQDIPYKNGVDAINGLLSNDLKWILTVDSLASGPIEAKKLLPIAIGFPVRTTKYPNVPTLRELGVDDKNLLHWNILVTNKNSDPEILNYVKTKLKDPLIRKEIVSMGYNVHNFNTNNFLRQETEKFKTILKQIKID